MWKVHVFNKYLLSSYSVPSTTLGTGALAVNTTDKISVIMELTFQKGRKSGSQSTLCASKYRGNFLSITLYQIPSVFCFI